MIVSQEKVISGDCLQIDGDSSLSKLIIFFEKMQTKNAWASHIACVISSDLLIEAIGKAKITDIKKYDSLERKIRISRIPLTNEQRIAFKKGAFEVANRMYGWTKLPLFALDSISTGIARMFGRKKPIFFFTRRFGILSIPVCSQLYLYLLHKYCNYYLLDENGNKVSWRIASPDYLVDLLILPINKAEIIHSQNLSK